jgi:hypothetical protein
VPVTNCVLMEHKTGFGTCCAENPFLLMLFFYQVTKDGRESGAMFEFPAAYQLV